jgi:WD40 repeat protein
MADFFQMHASCSDDYGLRKIFKHCKRPCVGQWWYLDRVFECGSSVSHICFDSTGERLATGSNDGKVRIFDLTTQQDPRVVYYGYQQPRVINCVRPVSCLSFYPLGKYIATGSDGCDWRILDLTKGQEPKLRYYYCTTTSICFDSSGNFLATASDDGKVRIFNFGNWSEYWVNDNKCFVYSVSFDPAGKRLAIGSSDGKARVFHLERKEKNCEFCPNSRGCVCSVCFDLTGKYLATASSYEAYIFDLRKKCQLMVFSHADVVNSVCFDPAGKYLATGSAKGKAHIFDVAIQKEVMMFNMVVVELMQRVLIFQGNALRQVHLVVKRVYLIGLKSKRCIR